MNKYRFSDEATSDTVEAKSISAAVEKYLSHYDTAEMEAGDTFTARIYDPENVLLATVTVTADGKGRVQSSEIHPRS